MSKHDDIKRCPFCGHNEIYILYGGYGFYCTCPECGAFGPDAHSEKEAVRLWNTPINVIEDLNRRLRLACEEFWNTPASVIEQRLEREEL